jgi:PadR family transcriptional regulator PadR
MRGGRGPRCRVGPDPSGWTVRARVERFTEPAILLVLRQGPKHGYELLERLPEVSSEDGHIDLGNLYRLLRALEVEGLVSSEWQAESGPARRVYRLTASGAHLLDGWASSLVEVRSTVDRFLTLYGSGR